MNPYPGPPNSLVSAIRGPIMLMTLGGLAALDHFTPYTWSETWPVLIIMFGLLKLAERLTRPAAPIPGGNPS